MSLSKRNKRGFFIVLFLLLVVSYTPRVINSFHKTSDFKFTHQQLIIAEEELVVKKDKSKKRKITKKKKKTFKRLDRMTDPNTLTKEDWVNLGLSDKQAESLLRFAKRGLRSNEDIKKIYVLPEELYNLIVDSLYYPENFKNSQKIEYSSHNNHNKTKADFIPVELNNATQEELETIPGIGPFFAKNIIKRRVELGGFATKEQLLEIWKFDKNKFEEVNRFIFVDKSKIRKININLATIDELKMHPYISYKVANSIVKMREMKGDYQNLEDIQESKLINEELYIKLLPYIKLE